MPNLLVEFTEQPLVGGRQYHEMTANPDKPRRLCNLKTIVVYVLKNVHIQDAIERRLFGEGAQGPYDNCRRGMAAPFGDSGSQPLSVAEIRLKAHPALCGAVMQRCCRSADASANL